MSYSYYYNVSKILPYSCVYFDSELIGECTGIVFMQVQRPVLLYNLVTMVEHSQ